MTRFALPVFALLLAVWPGCRSAPSTKQSLPSGQVWLQLEPPSASVIIDEKPLLVPREAGGLRLSMPIGPHRFEISAPGYFAAYRDVTVQTGSPQSVQIALRPDPDAAIDSAPARPFGPRPRPLDAP